MCPRNWSACLTKSCPPLLLGAHLLACLAIAQTPAAPPTATVSGKVYNSVTNEPLRKADITLSSSNDVPGMEMALRMFGGDAPDPAADPKKAAPPPKTFAATTDANGEFHVDRVEPGDYFLKATHVGYEDLEYKPEGAAHNSDEPKLHVAAADALKDIVLRLIPYGAVAGRVVDEDGDPVPGVMVSALMGGRLPGKQMVPVDTAPANDRGEFRLGKVRPGTYYLSASVLHMDFMATAAPPPPADGSPETNYVVTYYPGTVDIGAATKVEVTAGGDTPGLTITLRKSLVTRVKGQALAADGTPMKGGMVMLMSQANIGSQTMATLHNDGTFELANVQPGSYTLTSVQMNGTQPTMQMQTLVVPKEGVSGVKLRTQPEQTIHGRVVVSGDKKPELKGKMVMLMADEGMSAMPAMGNVSDAGTFTLKVSGASYRLQFPAPAGTYLKSVVWNGRETLGQALDFTAGGAGSELVATLGTDGGKVDVSVTADGGKPGAEATVVLLPYDPAGRSEATAKSGDADANGHLALQDVPPGDYLAFAWREVEGDAWLDADFLKPFEKDAKRVSVSPQGNEKVELKQIPGSAK